MDYVPAHGNTNRLADRDDISGVRVLDGEDQGKQDRSLSLSLLSLPSFEHFSPTSPILTTRLCTGAGNRLRMQQLQQRDWIEQQVRERQLYQEQQRFTDKVHDDQTLHFNRLLTDAQNQHAAARSDMERSVKDANL